MGLSLDAMPHYELDLDGTTRHERGRTPEDAVRRALALGDEARVALGEAEGGTQWTDVRVDGVPRGRLRPRDRMRFRRD